MGRIDVDFALVDMDGRVSSEDVGYERLVGLR
ncbi:hypothetical protein J3D43_005721 [Paenibacillus xylanexedens]|nr:hypothetical protein [Paenibacillus xylanexedens]